MKKNIALLLALFLSIEFPAQEINYPKTESETTIDFYHGTAVADPYRWLENDTSKKTAQWVKIQNEFTQSYLQKIPFRDNIKKRLTELNNVEKYGMPSKLGDYYIFTKNTGLQNQSVYFIQKGINGTPKVLIDPNQLSPDGTTSVSISGFSDNKKIMAYSISKAGSDWTEMHFMNIETGQKLKDIIKWVKFSAAAFDGNEGFYYSRYEEPSKGGELSQVSKSQRVYYHKLGDEQNKDNLVYEDKENPLRYNSVSVTEDLKYLILYVSQGTDGSAIYFAPTNQKPIAFKPLIGRFGHHSGVIDHVNGQFLVQTDINAPKLKVVAISPDNVEPNNWKTIVPEQNAVLQSATTAGGKLFLTYMQDVCSVIKQYDYTGKFETELALPGKGTASLAGAFKEDKELFYSFASYNMPPTIFSYNIDKKKSTVFKKLQLAFDVNSIVTEQLFYTSKDGTKVPVFVTYKKGLVKNGQNPCLLYAYGGFNVNLTPRFSSSIIPLLEAGGVYAVANLRGGGEYGDDWHKAGMKNKKQNVFDDFIGAAEFLIKEQFTSANKLGCQGGSNGGLLIGTVINQRPDLFKVAFPQVGVMDMLRFQKFTVGWGWVDEYGSSDDANMFPYLLGYSPLHNVKPQHYPAVMVTTADHDDRVVPAHSFKYISALQKVALGSNPALIRIETNAGHGAGMSLTKAIELNTDILSYLLYYTNSTSKP